MTAEKPPIRITKQRAQAFLEAADVGIEEQIDSLAENHGIRLRRDGTIVPADQNDFELLEPGDKEDVQERIDSIMRAIDTLAIFRRRYDPKHATASAPFSRPEALFGKPGGYTEWQRSSTHRA